MTSFTCTKCNAATSVSISVIMESFCCPTCKALYVKNCGEFQFKSNFSYTLFDTTIGIGKKCEIGNETYEVTGMLVKHLGQFIYTREYVLQSNLGNFKYLSECEGHWILLKEINDVDFNKNSRLVMTYDTRVYNKYDYYNTEVVLAQGFFDINFEVKKASVVEYISPPFILSSENFNGLHFYLGEHIAKKEVKKMFDLETMPNRSGVGLLQPFPFHVLDTIKIFLIAAILILACFIFQGSQGNKEVLNNTLSINEYANKEYVSPSFEVVDIAVPIKINLYSDVSNSWAYAGVSVVNEETNEEEFAEKDIEYYSGYEDGYHWTEGSQSTNFHICGLKPGKYHLVISPSAENITPNITDSSSIINVPPEVVTSDNNSYTTVDKTTDSINKLYSGMYATEQSNSTKAKTLTISAELESPSNWNFGISIVVFVLLTIALVFYRRFFETWRWSGSSYSPYIK